MATEKNRLQVAEDAKKAQQKYRQIKSEVNAWREERASYWLDNIKLNAESPYLPVVDLPQDAIIELWQKLNTSAKVEISDLDLREMWVQLKQGENNMDVEMVTRLQMAIIGVAKLASQSVNAMGLPELNHHIRASESPEKNVVTCPVCAEISNLAVLTVPDGKRMMHCTTCEYEWPVQRTGCVFCGSEDSKQILYLDNKTFPGIEMCVCQVCGQYLKEIDGRQLFATDYYWEDMRTLPLNYATERWIEEEIKRDSQLN